MWSGRRTAPGRSGQNRAHERMHRTLQAEAMRPPAHHQSAQQARCERCCRESNAERSHEALDHRTPAAVDQPSTRPMPPKLPAPAYPGHDLVRRVSNAGTMRFQTRQLFIRPTLLQADIALEETADGIWSIYFSDVLLARLNARDFRL